MRARAACCCIILVAFVSGGAWAELMSKPVGLILNQSADSLFECVPFEAPLDASTPRSTILNGYRKLIGRYTGTHVSHIFFNVNFQRVAYDSSACESYWDCPNPESDTNGWPLRSWYVYKAGVDPFQVCIEQCRERGFSPWISVRMNDTHYNEERFKVFSLWWDHPEYRRGVGGFHDGFNFRVEAVREHYLALIREVLERYDVDGIELDWMRFPYHFKPGEEPQGLDVLTAFTREARALTQEWASRREHPVGLAARVPSTPDLAHGLGMDAARWAREGLVDILIPTSTWMPADTSLPVAAWRERIGKTARPFVLAAGADLYVQGVPGGPVMRDNRESQRGFTAAMLDSGADAIYLFNHFNHSDFRHEFPQPDGTAVMRDEFHGLLSEAGNLEAAVSAPRRHALTFRDTSAPGVDNPRPLPVGVDANQSVAFRLLTGPKPTSGRVTLRIGLDQAEGLWEAVLAAKANGTECAPIENLNAPGQFAPHQGGGFRYKYTVDQVAPRVVQFDVPLAALQPGLNTFEITHANGKSQKITWVEVYVVPSG